MAVRGAQRLEKRLWINPIHSRILRARFRRLDACAKCDEHNYADRPPVSDDTYGIPGSFAHTYVFSCLVGRRLAFTIVKIEMLSKSLHYLFTSSITEFQGLTLDLGQDLLSAYLGRHLCRYILPRYLGRSV